MRKNPMTLAHEITLVGEEFMPGAVVNTEIDTLLGYDAVMCGEFAIRTEDGYTHCPNYCEDSEITLHELNKLQIDPIILPAVPQSSKKRAKRASERSNESKALYVAVFSVGRDLCATKAFYSAENALACALWYALAYYS
ncbi:hypothetical protein N5J31_01845 [Acinetobacter johnsonii]|uniref:hypothetical protein n=1 Tax=Acinetobacter johnsonii TaxID=40214 RepID=UPI00244BE24E|nr:hypothetical protein [Acinetobacter johnsonii]MDH2045670.1 hypothetical protein [Acinetobacter johnsonii]